jgi:Arc/MetJ-type ribon-helix-helix transcriptional regulator
MSDEPLTVSVPAPLARALRDAVAAGEYASVEAALADALERWSHRHEEAAEELAWMKARILRARLDPTPDFSEEELDARLNAFFAAAERAADEAA